jgi:uncharacterized membrane protein
VSERSVRAAAATLAVVGAAIASYLLYVHQTGSTLACATGGCQTVQSSRYAELLGLPVAAFGLAAFLALLVTAIASGELARTVQAVVGLAAVGFSGYLLYVQLGVIGAVCEWCLAGDALLTGLAALALLRIKLAAESR